MLNYIKMAIGYVTGVVPSSKKEIEAAITEEFQQETKAFEAELEEAKTQEKPDRSYCIFFLNDDNTVSIDYHFKKGCNSAKFGEMLYHINNGDLVPWMVKMLNNITDQHNHLAPQIQGIFDGWNEQITTKDSIIKPSQVFQNHNQQST